VKLPEAIGGVRAPVGIGCAINDLSAMELDADRAVGVNSS
jgi:hypothetical protein